MATDFPGQKFTPPAMKQFSLKLDDVGRSISDIKDNIRFPSIVENIQQVIDSGILLEKEVQTTDLRWFQMNILPYIIAKAKKTDGVIITFVEITMRIGDLKEQEKLLVEHEILLDTISHDIKTPLTSLGLTIEMLRKIPEKGMEKFPMLLGKVENSLLKMKDIIHDLTESRQSEHRYKAVEELLDFGHILKDVRLTLAEQICQSEIFFVRRKLRSVIYNLVSNAIKYRIPEKLPTVHINVSKEDDFTIISVKDNGRGIAVDDLDNIFAKYERLSKDKEGTGIGLYLVKEIVTLAGGKIEVESELGKGSTFMVFLKNQV